MNRTPLSDRLSDWINPLILKEIRQFLNSRTLPVFCILALGASWCGMAAWSLNNDLRRNGQPFFSLIFCSTLVIGLFGIGLPAGLRWNRERNGEGVDPVAMTTLTPRQIICGKLGSALLMLLFAYSLLAPFMVGAYLLGGLYLSTIFTLLYLEVLMMLPILQLLLLLGSQNFSRLGSRPLSLHLTAGGLCLVLLFFLFFLIDSLDQGRILFSARVLFGALPLLSLTVTLLLAVATGALIAPRNANRMLPLRVLFWLLPFIPVGLSALLPELSRSRTDLLLGVGSQLLILALLQLLIAIGERTQQSRRVLQRLPRNPVLRLPVALLSSGLASGVLNSLLFAGIGALLLNHPLLSSSDKEWVEGLLRLYLWGLFLCGISAAAGVRWQSRSSWWQPQRILIYWLILAALAAWVVEVGNFRNPVLRESNPLFCFLARDWWLPLILAGVGLVLLLPLVWRGWRSNWRRP